MQFADHFSRFCLLFFSLSSLGKTWKFHSTVNGKKLPFWISTPTSFVHSPTFTTWLKIFFHLSNKFVFFFLLQISFIWVFIWPINTYTLKFFQTSHFPYQKKRLLSHPETLFWVRFVPFNSRNVSCSRSLSQMHSIYHSYFVCQREIDTISTWNTFHVHFSLTGGILTRKIRNRPTNFSKKLKFVAKN